MTFFSFLNRLIHHRQIVIPIIGHRIAWRFGGGQGIWLGFAFVPAFEFVGFAVCLIGVRQSTSLFEGEVIAGHWCFLVLGKTCWRRDSYAVSIYELLGDLFPSDYVIKCFSVRCSAIKSV